MMRTDVEPRHYELADSMLKAFSEEGASSLDVMLTVVALIDLYADTMATGGGITKCQMLENFAASIAQLPGADEAEALQLVMKNLGERIARESGVKA